MPIYEYECTNCHHHFDVIQKINDEPISLCPNCSKNTAVKQVSASGFQLKGTGWYVTDFKNKQSAPKEEKKTETKESTTKTETATKDTK